MAKEDPAAFLKIGLHFFPREISIEHTNAMTEMSDEDLQQLLARAQAMLKIVDVTPEKAALPAPKVKPTRKANNIKAMRRMSPPRHIS